MQLGAEVRRGHVKKPDRVKIGDFRLRFDTGTSGTKDGLTKEQATAYAKARWFGFLGIKAPRGNSEDTAPTTDTPDST